MFAVFINGVELPLDITTRESGNKMCLDDDLQIEVVFGRNAAVPGNSVQGEAGTKSGRYRVSELLQSESGTK